MCSPSFIFSNYLEQTPIFDYEFQNVGIFYNDFSTSFRIAGTFLDTEITL